MGLGVLRGSIDLVMLNLTKRLREFAVRSLLSVHSIRFHDFWIACTTNPNKQLGGRTQALFPVVSIFAKQGVPHPP